MSLNAAAHGLSYSRAVVGMNEIEKRFFGLRELAGLESKDSLELWRPHHAIGAVKLARPRSHAAAGHRQAQPFSVFKQSLFGALAFHELADLIADAANHCQQGFIGF